MNSTTSRKILTRERLRERIEQWRSAGEKITLANGCFDLLHVGHIRYLDAARQLGGKLVVAVNSDESVRALKGEGVVITRHGHPVVELRPIPETVRAVSEADLDWLVKHRIERRSATKNAGELVSAMRDEDQR